MLIAELDESHHLQYSRFLLPQLGSQFLDPLQGPFQHFNNQNWMYHITCVILSDINEYSTVTTSAKPVPCWVISNTLKEHLSALVNKNGQTTSPSVLGSAPASRSRLTIPICPALHAATSANPMRYHLPTSVPGKNSNLTIDVRSVVKKEPNNFNMASAGCGF